MKVSGNRVRHATLPRPVETGSGTTGAHPDPDTDTAAAVETALAAWLSHRTDQARSLDARFGDEVAESVAGFVLRGGRRLRAQCAWWGWRAGGGEADGEDAATALRVAASLELLQAMALIHDDVMDGSDLRRGAAAVHVEFTARHDGWGERGGSAAFGVSAAILAGDLALVWAEDMLSDAELDDAARERVKPLWRAMRTEMVAGQYLDLRSQGTADFAPATALRVAALKSAAYTVERPLGIGAALAGADRTTRRRLEAAARSAGLAFQLRDDLDGVFGDPAETGKPAGDDVREGKVTYLAAVARDLADRTGDGGTRRLLRDRLGDAGLTSEGLDDYRQAVTRVGARTAVEEHIDALLRDAFAEIFDAGLPAHAEERLVALLRAAARGAAPDTAPDTASQTGRADR